MGCMRAALCRGAPLWNFWFLLFFILSSYGFVSLFSRRVSSLNVDIVVANVKFVCPKCESNKIFTQQLVKFCPFVRIQSPEGL